MYTLYNVCIYIIYAIYKGSLFSDHLLILGMPLRFDNIRCPQLRRDLSCSLETVGHQRTNPSETFGFYLNSGRCRGRVPAGSMRCVGQATHAQASGYASETNGFPKEIVIVLLIIMDNHIIPGRVPR